jgi:hypothetical protein
MAEAFATLEIDGQRADFWVLEPADLGEVEVVEAQAGGACLRVPRALLAADLASGDDTEGGRGSRP